MTCPEKQQDGGWWEDALAQRCAFPIAPVNTWTNLAYPLAGAVILWHGTNGAHIVEAVMLALLGIGSGLYHGFKTHFSGMCDDVGMLLVFGGMALYAVSPSAASTPAAMAIAAGGLAVWRFANGERAKNMNGILGLFVGIILTAASLHAHIGGALLGLGILAVAYFGCWKPDHARTFPLPRWGHGVWHILTAVGITVLFLAL